MAKQPIFSGAGVAIVTPFDADNRINYPVFQKLIDWQIAQGTDAIIVCGTTGESPTLTHVEHSELIRQCVQYVGGRVPVIAGTGSNDTAFGLKLSNEAERDGVDGLLMVTPYYNKTSQQGLVDHFTYLADRVSTPIILYNVPSRTGLNIQPATYQALSAHKNINAAKEANGDVSSLAQTAALCGDELVLYSGNDDQIVPFMSLGAAGVISVLSNVVPKTAHDIAAAALAGDYKTAAALQLGNLDLCTDLFADVNPVPVKEALNLMGWGVGDCRLPLTKIGDGAREKLLRALKNHQLI
ncbi:MAG: 4-hydroxy-tetrahydrodipicolinate synthase [Oscillospiraceae bacterium]|jgi:4-hydroxy-tetrahydrodipicolinate synthase|nr:4-hydroxy-tetrahydrodipicolinate synthase [Oscillospiraceae bacterium]